MLDDWSDQCEDAHGKDAAGESGVYLRGGVALQYEARRAGESGGEDYGGEDGKHGPWNRRTHRHDEHHGCQRAYAGGVRADFPSAVDDHVYDESRQTSEEECSEPPWRAGENEIACGDGVEHQRHAEWNDALTAFGEVDGFYHADGFKSDDKHERQEACENKHGGEQFDLVVGRDHSQLGEQHGDCQTVDGHYQGAEDRRNYLGCFDDDSVHCRGALYFPAKASDRYAEAFAVFGHSPSCDVETFGLQAVCDGFVAEGLVAVF